MLTYLKPGDIYQKNDVLEPSRVLNKPCVPSVVGGLAFIKPGDPVHIHEMPMKPRRWTPDNE